MIGHLAGLCRALLVSKARERPVLLRQGYSSSFAWEVPYHQIPPRFRGSGEVGIVNAPTSPQSAASVTLTQRQKEGP